MTWLANAFANLEQKWKCFKGKIPSDRPAVANTPKKYGRKPRRNNRSRLPFQKIILPYLPSSIQSSLTTIFENNSEYPE